jgi:hypothetical protein
MSKPLPISPGRRFGRLVVLQRATPGPRSRYPQEHRLALQALADEIDL